MFTIFHLWSEPYAAFKQNYICHTSTFKYCLCPLKTVKAKSACDCKSLQANSVRVCHSFIGTLSKQLKALLLSWDGCLSIGGLTSSISSDFPDRFSVAI